MSQAPQEPPAGPPSQPPDEPRRPRNTWVTGAVVAGVAVLAIVLFFVLRPDDEDDTPDTTAAAQTTTPETTTEEATTEEATTEETTTEEAPTTTEGPPPPHRVVVVVRNAQPVGGVKHVPIAQGEQVVLVVRSDVEDEVHLHGYDLAAEVAPGQPARIRFRADDVGEFEVELEERGVPIVELVVS